MGVEDGKGRGEGEGEREQIREAERGGRGKEGSHWKEKGGSERGVKEGTGVNMKINGTTKGREV